VLVAIDRVGLDRRADVGDHLVGEAAVGGGEGLPFALCRVDGLGEGDPLDRGGGLVGGQQVADLGLQRDLEWILRDRRLVAAVRGRPIVERGRVAEGGGAGPGDPDGLAGDPVGLGGGHHVRGREPPGAVDEHTDAEPLALPGGNALDPSGLDRDALVPPAHDPDVRIPGAQHRGRVERPIGQLLHARRSLAEGRSPPR
jgi:hypothetical protein